MHVTLANIFKTYVRQRVFNDLSVEFSEGELIGLLGVNGAGKTTLLRILAGVCGTDKGEVKFDGEAFNRDNVEQRKKLMYVPDVPMLFNNVSGLENISRMMKLWGVSRDSDEIVYLLDKLSMLEYAKKPVATLSRGQLYKVGLICLMVVDPDLVLIDEPFASGMDQIGLNVFKKYALDAVSRGKTVVFTTQMLDLTKDFATRVLFIKDGQLALDGSHAKLADSELLGSLLGETSATEI